MRRIFRATVVWMSRNGNSSLRSSAKRLFEKRRGKVFLLLVLSFFIAVNMENERGDPIITRAFWESILAVIVSLLI